MKMDNNNRVPPASYHSLRSCPFGVLLTADKRLRYASSKLPTATFFIRKTLYEIPNTAFEKEILPIKHWHIFLIA